ncbi:MAG: alpha/beta hydrolase [Bacteriovoracaceae bacterium]|nr:alpha/beta hydrolase [Bacteriovoracaceae bacterium]
MSKKAVILVHGLNNTKAVMKDLTQFYKGKGYDTFNVELKGHHADIEKIKNLTKEDWKEDVLSMYKKIEPKYKEITYVGYSLGGLIGGTLLLDNKVKFKRVNLFAPAFKVNWYVNFVKFFMKTPIAFSLTSKTPKSYRSNKRLTPLAYNTLFNLIDEFNEKIKTKSKNLNIPLNIYMDPKDELVSFSKLQVLKNEYKLKWNLYSFKSVEAYRHVNTTNKAYSKKDLIKIRSLLSE